MTIASDYEQEGLKHVLSKNAYRSMADNHLWFSIFAYHLPSAKRFTRIQRCTCCFVLLLMTLLMNIMFYDSKEEIENDELNQYDLTVGPFIISKEQVVYLSLLRFSLQFHLNLDQYWCSLGNHCLHSKFNRSRTFSSNKSSSSSNNNTCC